jgi:hypothetical protein
MRGTNARTAWMTPHPVPVVEGEVPRAGALHDSGVVAEHVNGTEAVERHMGEAVDVLPARDVDRLGDDVGRRLAQ